MIVRNGIASSFLPPSHKACNAVGGIMGYKKKRSKDSLIASSIIAGLMLVSAFLMSRPDTTYGVRLALGKHLPPAFFMLRDMIIGMFTYQQV